MVQSVGLHDGNIFFFCPALFLYVRIKVVMPSFSTLLAYSSMKVLSDKRPIFRTVLHNHLPDDFVFLCSPRPLHQDRVEHLLPPVEALNIGPILEKRCNFFPISSLRSTNATPYLFTNSLSFVSSSGVQKRFLAFFFWAMSWVFRKRMVF